jgi:hypothetical protein
MTLTLTNFFGLLGGLLVLAFFLHHLKARILNLFIGHRIVVGLLIIALALRYTAPSITVW